MRASETVGIGLFPGMALVAALFFGFQAPPEPSSMPPVTRQPVAVAAAQPRDGQGGLGDVRPVMELLAEAMGVDVPSGDQRELTAALEADLKGSHLLGSQFEADDHTLHVSRSNAAKKARRDNDDQLFDSLVKGVTGTRCSAATASPNDRRSSPGFDVRFLVATIPDYVDSNGGWLADQILSAIQAAMSREGYSLDRFRLIDWSRGGAGENPTASDSRLHEHQPGALIFSKVDPQAASTCLYVVLLALETATSGVHSAAVREAIDFVYRWSERVPGNSRLQIVGPTYSGSVPSLARALTREQSVSKFGQGVFVISGSANADDNLNLFNTLASGVNYATTLQPTSALRERAREFLQERGFSCENTALLIESNTAYGLNVTGNQGTAPARLCEASQQIAKWRFSFPLHVSQLRGQTRAGPVPTLPLLSSVLVPLNLREAIPPADQVPALRPAMTSPTVEATMGIVFDTIRHQNIQTVGVFATDTRDVLFLSRELKRAAPNVQLVLFGSHALYLHPEYSPYMRGALVASSYSQSLNVQLGGDTPNDRMAFENMESQGVFNAVIAQMAIATGSTPRAAERRPLTVRATGLLDYCSSEVTPAPEAAEGSCEPPVWLSVIGSDGFWPVASFPAAGSTPSVLRATSSVIQQPLASAPVPALGAVLSAVLLTLGALYVGSLAFLGSSMRGWRDPSRAEAPKDLRHFLRWPLLSFVAPPVAYRRVRVMHGVVLVVLSVLVALLCTWTLAVVAGHTGIGASYPGFRAVVLVLTGVTIIALGWWVAHEGARTPCHVTSTHRPSHTPWGQGTMVMTAVLMLLTVGTLAWWIGAEFLTSDHLTMLTAVRTMGGGIVSPAAAVVCLCTALGVPVMWSLRRLSLVGVGYTELASNSETFHLLSERRFSSNPAHDSPRRSDTLPAINDDIARLTSTLDSPLQNLGWSHVGTLAVVLSGIILTIGPWTRTMEHSSFSLFFGLGSALAITCALLLLAQAGQTWRLLQAHLERLARGPLGPAFERVDHTMVRWKLSLAPPRLSDLCPVVKRVERLSRELALLIDSARAPRKGRRSARHSDETVVSSNWDEHKFNIDERDAVAISTRLDGGYEDTLVDELVLQRFSALLQSKTFLDLWKLSDLLVVLLKQIHWPREHRASATVAHTATNRPNGSRPSEGLASNDPMRDWLDACEVVIALQFAFVFRDVLSRVVSALFAAILTVTLVSSAHLFYAFQARWTYLVIDTLMLIVASSTAIWILVAIERDHVISLLRNTKPGRVNFDWDFIRRLAIYGLLPLCAVLGALFPEVGESLFGWLEPLRRLVSV